MNPFIEESMPILGIVFNPTKNRKKLDIAVRLLKKYGFELRIRESQNFEHITELTRQFVEENVDIIIAAGGDGTLLQTLNGLIESDIPLAILPLGCSNDCAKALNINSIYQAVEVIRNAESKLIDIGKVSYINRKGEEESKYFCTTAGIGFFAEVLKKENNRLVEKLKTVLYDITWPILGTITFFSFSKKKCTIQFNDDQEVTTKLWIMEFSNVKQIGGILHAPYAHLANGIIDMWWIREVSKLRFAKTMLTYLFIGWKKKVKSCEYFYYDKNENSQQLPPTKVAVDSNNEHAVHVHGDYLGRTPFRFENDQRKLRILC